MLRGIHKASSNWIGRIVMGVVLGLIAISFSIWGIGDIFQGASRTAVATVGKSEIRIETFRQLYQDRLQQVGRQLGRPIMPDQARAIGLDRQLLGQVIAESALDQRASALRLAVSPAEVARQVTEDPNFRGINGQFDRARFEAVIRNASFTEARFLDEQRRTMMRQQLVGTLSAEPSVSKTALEAFNRFQNEERAIDFVTLGPDQAGERPEPAPDVLASYFEERKAAFRAPEFRKVTLVTLTPTELASSIEISDEDLKKAYQDRRTRYETPERRHLKQIVFPSLDEAKDAAAKLAAGTTFEALATERGLKDTDIDLGTIAQSAVVDREVGDAAFKLAAGQVSAPIEGRFGIAIVKVESIEPAQTRPFDEVAGELKREMATERARSELIDVQEKVEDERLGGATLVEAAQKFDLKPRVIEAIDRSGNDRDGKPVPDLPEGIDVVAAVFGAEINGEDEPLRIPNRGGYVWFNVDAVAPAHDRTLDEVKDKVVARWQQDQIADRLRTKANAMIDKIKGGTAFGDVIAAEGLKTEWRPGIKRGAPPPGLSAGAVADIFRTPKDAAGAAEGTSPTEWLVYRVAEVKVPPLDPQSEAAKRVEAALRERNAEDIVAQYLANLQNEIGVTINETALNQVSGGSSQNF